MDAEAGVDMRNRGAVFETRVAGGEERIGRGEEAIFG